MAQLPFCPTHMPTTGEDQQRALATQVACGCIATASVNALLRGHEGAREFCRQYAEEPGATGACCIAMLFGFNDAKENEDEKAKALEDWINFRGWAYQQVLRLVFKHHEEGGCFYCQHENKQSNIIVIIGINQCWYDNLKRLEASNDRGAGEVEAPSPVPLPREPVTGRRVGLKRHFKRQ